MNDKRRLHRWSLSADSSPFCDQTTQRMDRNTVCSAEAHDLDVNEMMGSCVKCTGSVHSSDQACQAMGQIFHTKCFTCSFCNKQLKGKPFYYFSGSVFCEEDYLYSSVKQLAEVCTSCGYLISDTVIQALGKSFHPDCFHCVICKEKLEGQQFNVDTQQKIYCVKDYRRFVAQTCEACGLLILPTEGSNETVRVVSMGRNYHVTCYEDKSNI
ncbi:LIM domain-containing protein 1 isoform X2 [Triplophysa dalaica]|uniref:LIM domain-containing protein 1 isoform X2 n=1 Tax=Triplophysa dalaica TaxID=1582913 RepID=UPI0024DF7AD6|nr:LIM domain-containing protein 1 isoform X2 [Triplophysa dalaica]